MVFLKLKSLFHTHTHTHKHLTQNKSNSLVHVYHSMAQIIKREELVIARDGASE